MKDKAEEKREIEKIQEGWLRFNIDGQQEENQDQLGQEKDDPAG